MPRHLDRTRYRVAAGPAGRLRLSLKSEQPRPGPYRPSMPVKVSCAVLHFHQI
jgi:hypothetical protein